MRRRCRDLYDLLIVGGGTGGLVSAQIAAGMGARVALVERERTGGDCLWTGCVPSKSLLAAARLAQRMRHADRVGLAPVEPEIDFAAVMGHVHGAIRAIEPHDSPERLRAAGVDVVHGDATFTAPRTVAAGGRTLRGRAVIVATGSEPVVPPVPGLAEARPLTTDTVWALRELPGRLLVLGGGPVGCELAQAFARLGSRVTLVEQEERLLGADEPEAAVLVADVLREEGVDVRLGAAVERMEGGPAGGAAGSGEGVWTGGAASSGEGVSAGGAASSGEGVSAGGAASSGEVVSAGGAPSSGQGVWAGGAADGGEGRPGGERVAVVGSSRIAVDALLVAAGRRPRTEGLGAAAAAIALDDRGAITVDERLRTSAERTFAVGDVTALLPFTHVAAHHARVATLNALLGTRGTVDETIPWVTFTEPEVARVGLSAAQARERWGAKAVVQRVEYAAVDRAICEGETRGFALLVGDRRARLVGATVAAAGAGEAIAELTARIANGDRIDAVSRTVHAYPTFAEGPARAADQVLRERYAARPYRALTRAALALRRFGG